jgi:Uma2 family endonuclease
MNASAPMRWIGPPTPEPHRFTLDDVLALQKAGVIDWDARIELLDGEIIDMPEEGELHVWFKVELTRFFVRALGDEFRLAPDATLSLAPRDAPEPDIYVFPVGAPLRLTPGSVLRLLVEISDTTLDHDLKRKVAKYASYGVPEYWVLDVQHRRTFVHLQPEGDTYLTREVVPFDGRLVPTLLPDIALVVADLPGYGGLSFG